MRLCAGGAAAVPRLAAGGIIFDSELPPCLQRTPVDPLAGAVEPASLYARHSRGSGRGRVAHAEPNQTLRATINVSAASDRG